MIVVITAEAEADLESIGDHIAEESPKRALSFVEELHRSCLELADMAHAFPLAPRYEQFGVRRRVHGNYLIFYRAEADRIVILHVLHGAIDYAQILFANEAPVSSPG